MPEAIDTLANQVASFRQAVERYIENTNGHSWTRVILAGSALRDEKDRRKDLRIAELERLLESQVHILNVTPTSERF